MSVLSKLRVISQIDPDKLPDDVKERKKIYDGVGESRTDAINIAGTTGVTEELLATIGKEISDPSTPASKGKLRIVTATTPEQAPPEALVEWLGQNLYNIVIIPAPLNTIDRKSTYEWRKRWIDSFSEVKTENKKGLPLLPNIHFVGYIFLNPDATSTRIVGADVERGKEKIEEYVEESLRWTEACYLESSGVYGDPNLVRRAKKHAVDLGYPNFPIIYGGAINTVERGVEMRDAGTVYLDEEKKTPSCSVLVLGDIIHKGLKMHSKIVEVIKTI